MHRLFRDEFVEVFNAHFDRLRRYLGRLSGEPELAADIAQETFMKLYQRGALPDAPGAWLVTVATNLLRNARATRERRGHLLAVAADAQLYADRPIPPAAAGDSGELRCRVRSALDRMPERERQLLLLRAEGYNYRDIALALDLREASVGTLLARAKRAFRDHYEDRANASR
ncbi:MAG TPA: sigma-70 family RNA polymerase sigma factor [Candidatus Krumholzibacteria bacterium]|nr:sigma-70 family RNA polymerase sigma factor [Candidatus Krumholzibacteria bacterium]